MDPAPKSADLFGNAPLLDDDKGNKGSVSGASEAQEQHRQGPSYRTASGSYRSYLWRSLLPAVKFVVVFGGIAALLAIPLIVIDPLAGIDAQAEIDTETLLALQRDNLVYFLFFWFFISWLGLAVSYLLGTALPYLFRFAARYVNPAYARYWRVLRPMRRPIAITGLVCVSYLAFAVLFIYGREDAAIGTYERPSGGILWISMIDDFLQQGTIWASLYLLEKIVILYITVHYHSRSNLGRITQSKDMHNTLMALYEASLYLYPVGTPEFAEEDTVIGNATGAEHGEYRVRATRYLARLGIDTYALTSFFGNFLTSDPKSHWLNPGSSYATVERALANPKSAAALARRIWMAMVPVGKEALTAQDIAEVLGPFRKEEAQAYFKTLDEGEMGDIRLDEMEWTVAEAGRVRHDIYRSMHSADHCINTLDWVLLAALATVMVYFIVIYWVPTLRDIQQTVQFLGFGLAFAVGKTLHHFLAGTVFILFDHPYDIGDRVELWSGQSAQSVSLIVVRTSLLYTVFKRVDSWMELQAGNEWLQQCRVENVTRSGANRQFVTLLVDIGTSFRDLQFLRGELEAFLRAPENRRDYLPTVALAIASVGELSRLELRCIFAHRTNWSSEPLRAARSMRFMCALLAAVRKIPLRCPDDATLGRQTNPAHYVVLTPDEAARARERVEAEERAKRGDAPAEGLRAAGQQQHHGPVIDVSDVQRQAGSEGGEGVSDEELVRRAVEEAEKKRREAADREAEELAARQNLGRIPAVPRKGPPPRGKAGEGALTTGFQPVGEPAGLRSLPYFKR